MVRIMTYNIHQGGAGRLQDIAHVVRQACPDILGMLEANGWGDNEQRALREFSATTGLPYTIFTKSNTEFDLALLSRQKPTSVSVYREHIHHSMIVAEFSFRGLDPVCITLLHLNPFTEDARLEEIRQLMALLTRRATKNKILMGDFNMLSPYDPYDHHALFTKLRTNGNKKFGETALRFDTLRELKVAGYHDVMELTHQPFTPTVPTPANADYAHAAPLRLDYIFISQTLAPTIAAAQVITALPTDRASDHYPVIADFMW